MLDAVGCPGCKTNNVVNKMKATQAASLLLFGSAPVPFASARLLQGDNNTSIFSDEVVSPIDLVANDVAAPTQPAATTDAQNDTVVTTSITADEVATPFDLVANNATAVPTQSAAATDAPNDSVITTAAPTDPVDSDTSSTGEQSAGTQTGSGSTLVFDNGDQNTLDPNEISDKNNIQVTNYSTLFITDNSISINGYCDDCIFPNSTIDVSVSSNLIIEGDDISIYGSNQASIMNQAGGSAIELRSLSRGKISGSVMIRGGDGDETAGVGGDALGVFDESSVEIGGDVILQGGVGVEAGKALMVDAGSTAQINSGTYKSEVLVENGSIDVNGGTFENGVTVEGDGASATFNGCFATTIVEDTALLRTVELSGMFSNSTEMQTIEVTLVDGGVLMTVGGGGCADASITTDNSTVVSDDESGEYVGDTSTYSPTFMPTAFSGSVRGTPNLLANMSIAAGLFVIMSSF